MGRLLDAIDTIFDRSFTWTDGSYSRTVIMFLAHVGIATSIVIAILLALAFFLGYRW